jgi:glycosyltransferase involved in cell wall biosynthesis
MPAEPDRLRILHVLLSIGETSAPYNEHCLAAVHKREIAVCTYFPSRVIPPQTIALFEGDGSPTGFVCALKAALASRAWDIIHVHAPQAALVLLATHLWARRELRAASVYTVHNSFHNYKVRNRLLLIPTFLCFRRVVCCSRVARDSFPRLFRRLAGGRLCVVQNGVDIDRLDRIVATGSTRDGAFTVTSVGQLIERKDPQCVLDAFAAADDRQSRLVFVGAGHLRERLTGQIRARGIADRVEFTGLVPRETVYEHLSRAHVFVSASRGEGLPVAVLEAMACRCPVVLSDIPPHREIAAGTDFIRLVPPGDVDAFAREVKKFRAMSPDERMAIGQKCREVAECRFSLRAMHAGYENVYTQVLDGRPETRPRGSRQPTRCS